jgi:hypothetical protein
VETPLKRLVVKQDRKRGKKKEIEGRRNK